jgi:DNA repair ATPase RecN
MKQVEKIWAELSAKNTQEVELSEEKVELSIAQDLQKVLSDAKSTISNAQKAYDKLGSVDQKLVNQVRKAMSDADNAAEDYQSARDEATKMSIIIADVLEQAERAAKDLGVDAKSIKGYSELDGMYNDVDALPADYNWTDLRPIVS